MKIARHAFAAALLLSVTGIANAQIVVDRGVSCGIPTAEQACTAIGNSEAVAQLIPMLPQTLSRITVVSTEDLEGVTDDQLDDFLVRFDAGVRRLREAIAAHAGLAALLAQNDVAIEDVKGMEIIDNAEIVVFI